MTNGVTLESVEAMAGQLPIAQRVVLARKILDEAALVQKELADDFRWTDMCGIAPNLLGGEDAQEWVSRSRRADQEHSDRVLRGEQ